MTKQGTPEPDAPTGYSEPDEQGNRYLVRKVGKQVEVHLLTADGRAVNTIATSETEGRKALLAYIGGK